VFYVCAAAAEIKVYSIRAKETLSFLAKAKNTASDPVSSGVFGRVF
jgi:hypothetical protein